MEEPGEMGVLESTVTVSEVAGGEDRLGSDACLGQGQGQGQGQTETSLSVGSVGRERAGGTCNGEDVMVKVLLEGSGKAELTKVEAASDAYTGQGLSCTESDNQNLKAETVCVSAKPDIEDPSKEMITSLESRELLDSDTSSSGLVQNDQPVTNVEQICLNYAHQIKEKEPEEEVDNLGCVAMDGTSSGQPIQLDAESVKAPVNKNISLNPNVENSFEIRKKIELEKGSDCTEQRDFNMMDTKEDKSTGDESAQANMKYGQEIEVKHDTNIEQCGFHAGKEMNVTEVTDDKPTNIDEDFSEPKGLEPGISSNVNQARYHMPAENENEFFVSDLVWGKVRSHPWWPGQIFDPSHSSEKAIKHHKKDCFLVAYFGDRTFAWNETSFLKPFRTHFSDMEKQSSSESFQNAVDCALEEVSRRIELGLACDCMQKDVYDRIRFQNVDNAGIREESSRRDRAKICTSTVTFEADKLINYLKELAKFPTGGSDRLELVIAMTQLAAFNNLRGCGSLPKFQLCGDLVENEEEPLENEVPASEFIQNSSLAVDDALQQSSSHEILKGQNGCLNIGHDNFHEILCTNKKERSLSELMGETLDSRIGDSMTDRKSTNVMVSSSLGKKRKAIDYYTDDSTAEGRLPSAKVSKVIYPKQSFKIGDCIRRAASQMTGNTFVKVNTEKFQKGDGSIDEPVGDGFDHTLQGFEDDQRGKALTPISAEILSLDELLSQLQLAAQDPLKGCSFSSIVVSFFSEFRDSLSLGCQNGIENLTPDKVGGKRKKSYHNLSPEIFEFEDMSDTYWTDRVIENGTEGQPLRKNRKRDTQLMLVESEKSPREGRRPHSRKRYAVGNHDLAAVKFTASADGRSPGELVMNFSEVDSVPSEMSLIKMFRRFGPLRESETEVDREGGRARVIFKNRSDAEVAYSSAGKFNIFGQRLVNYQLNYTPTLMFKTPPIAPAHDHGIHLDFSSSQYHEMQLDLTSIQDHEMQLDLASLDDHEMQLDLSSIQYPEMEPILFTAQLEDMQSNISLIHCEEKQPELSGFQQREMKPDLSAPQLAISHDLKSQTNHLIMSDRNMEQDCSTPGNEYTEHEFSPNENDGLNHESIITEDQCMNHDLTTTEGQSMNPDPTIFKDEEMIPEHSTTDEQNMNPGYATENQDMNPVPTHSEDEKNTNPGYATENQDMNPVPTHSEDEKMIPSLATIDDQVRNPDLTTTEDLDVNPNLTSATDKDMECDFRESEDQDTKSDLNTVEDVEKSDITPTGVHDMKPEVTIEVQELKHGLITIQDRDMEPDLFRIENKDAITDLANSQDLKSYFGLTSVEKQETEPSHATTLEMDEHIVNTTMKKHDTETNHVTTQDIDSHSDHEKIQEQDIHDLEIKQDGGYQVDYDAKLEIIEKDEMQTEAEKSPEQEIKSDISPTPDRETHPDPTTQIQEM